MSIRWKLFLFLLCVVLPPLALGRWHSTQEALNLGRDLARQSAADLTAAADKELALTADLYGEALEDSSSLFEGALRLLAGEAARALASPAPPDVPVFFSKDFDGTTEIPGAKPMAGVASGIAAQPPARVSYDVASFLLAPGASPEAVSDEIARLSGLTPLFRILFAEKRDRLLYAYAALPDGLLCSYPGHGGYPPNYDPRRRPWYEGALAKREPGWRVYVDAITRTVVANVSMPFNAAGGRGLGVVGLDIPLSALLPESDPTRLWAGRMQVLLASLDVDAEGSPGLRIIARRDQPLTQADWRAAPASERLSGDNDPGLAALIAAVAKGRSGVTRAPWRGEEASWAFRRLGDSGSVLLLVVPHAAAAATAIEAERGVMARTGDMLVNTGLFSLGAAILVLITAFFGSRAVTRPAQRLAEAAGRLAEGDLDARVPAKGKDELAALGRSFNDMVPKLAERLRLKNDLELAMEVQQHLLPHAPPRIPGLDVAGATFFCDETGGDFYDYLEFSADGRGLDVVVGDVTGHGISAALFMATGRALLRAKAGQDFGPGELMTRVNALLSRDTYDSGRFLTMFFLRFEDRQAPRGGALRFVRAGHDPAVILSPAEGTFRELGGDGIPLGVMPDWIYQENAAPGLAPGEILVVGTDGVWEAEDQKDNMFGRGRFREVLLRNADKPAREIIQAVVAAVTAFQGERPRQDDITLVIVKALP